MNSQTEKSISRRRVVIFVFYIAVISLLCAYILIVGNSHVNFENDILKGLFFVIIIASVGGALTFFSDIFVTLEKYHLFGGRNTLTWLFGLRNTPTTYKVPGVIILIFAFLGFIHLIEKYGFINIVRALIF